MKTFFKALIVVAALTGPVAAQGPTPPTPPQGRGQNPAPAPAPNPNTPPILPEELATPGQLVNVRIDVIVIEEGGGEPMTRKETSLILADRRSGSVRSAAAVKTADRFGNPQGQLSVDARPWVESDGRIRTQVTLDYMSQPYFSSWGRLKFEPLLESGRALVAAQTSSAISDRRVRVELTATILK